MNKKNLIIYPLLVISSLILFFPVLYSISASLMTSKEILNGQIITRSFNYHNYINAFKAVDFGLFFTNSVIISISGMVLQLLTCSLAAFAITFIEFKYKKISTLIITLSIFVPWDAIIIPNYINIVSWNLLDTKIAMILPFATNGLGIFLIVQYFNGINSSIIEAAKIDGANYFKIYYSIILPLSKPILATWGIYAFLSMWNMYLWPLMVSTKASSRTIQIGLNMLKSQESTSNFGVLMAAAVMVMIPSLLVIFFGQKQIQEGITSGGVKG